jgi:hypothetical protein
LVKKSGQIGDFGSIIDLMTDEVEITAQRGPGGFPELVQPRVLGDAVDGRTE